MELSRIWTVIDQERTRLADLLDDLGETQWATPSLCDGWTVRDVGTHLAQAHASVGSVLWPLVRSGFSLERMTRRLATDSSLTHAEISTTLRAMVGSRRRAPMVTPLEPMLDILVHTQDIAVPLGLDVPMPLHAAAAAAERTFEYPGPLRFTRRYDDLAFVATDTDWRHGTAPDEVHGPISALLLTLTGRPATGLTGAVDRL